MLSLQGALGLLFEPRGSLKLLEFIETHPRVSPTAACRELRISLHTWYPSLAHLESLGLILIERAPGGRKVRRLRVTPAGAELLRVLQAIPRLLKGTEGALEWELERLGGAPSPAAKAAMEVRTGELLCRLIEQAERRAEVARLEALVDRAKATGRYGEAALARGTASYLQGDIAYAHNVCYSSLALLESEREGLSYRRALFLYAMCLEASGDDKGAFVALTKLRQMAKAAGDQSTEADTRLGIALLKARRSQFEDAASQLSKALACATRAGLPAKKAEVLATFCLVEFLLDPAKGLTRSGAALEAAHQVSAAHLVASVHANRALMFAVMGQRHEAQRELSASRAFARRAGGEVRGARDVALARLVRKLLRRSRGRGAMDLRGHALEILKVSRYGG